MWNSVGGTSFALMLECSAREARADVEAGVAHFRGILAAAANHRWLVSYVREAVRQLYKSYVTLAGEVTLLGGTGAGSDAGLERLGRSQLFHRVHQSGGDFALIGRLCGSLAARPERASVVREAEHALRRWANRDVHLFRLLVPLLYVAEELRADVWEIREAVADPARRLDACLRNAHRSMRPVFRELSLAAHLLHRFAGELDAALPSTAVPPARVRVSRAASFPRSRSVPSRGRSSGSLPPLG
jgi:hypothetical protein